ncbi:hypothetical protein AWB73_06753 [Caballeronia turbans]|nr:hypothetical protein AWB73_06753 [Caballeronia turbans]
MSSRAPTRNLSTKAFISHVKTSITGASARVQLCITRSPWAAVCSPLATLVSQGDGEISGTAIEASLNVMFQIVLRRDFAFPSPLLETPDFWIVHGFDEDLNIATKNASRDMVFFLTEQQGLS